MVQKCFLSRVLVIVACIVANINCNGQTIKLSDKFVALENKYEVNFSYNHTFFDAIYLDADFECNSISQCISILKGKVPLLFSNKVNSTNYTVIPKRESASFKIIDSDTNENINVIEYQINRKNKEPAFVEDGVFTLKNLFALDSITIYSSFYKKYSIRAKDLFKIETLKLNKKEHYLNEVVVNSYLTTGIKSKISDHSLQIHTPSLGLLAGETDGDIFNVLSNIPGIHSPSGKSGNLNFRGNTYDQNLVQIDDIPIYHSGHFFGAISPYNTSVITNVDVQRNMLPVQFGNRVGGLINMTTNNKIPERTTYDIALNTIFAGATIKSVLIKDKLSLTLAARRSYPEFRSPKLEAISTLIFQGSRLANIADQINNSDNFLFDFLDVNAKLNYKITDKHAFSLSFIDIQNNLSAEIKTNDNDTDFRDLELDNWGITGKWKADFSDKLTTEIRFSRSKMDLLSLSEGFTSSQSNRLEKYDNTISDLRFIGEATYTIKPNLSFYGGYTLTKHELISGEIEREKNIDSERKQVATIHSNFFSIQKNWKDKLTINFGFHNNYYAPTRNFYINPRLSGSYAFNNHFYLKSSFGSSNQFIQKKFTNDFDDFSITNQLWYLPNEEIAVQQGTQGMLGFIIDKTKWLIDLELYNKTTRHITNKVDNEQGTIYSKGANIFLKKKWHNLETWLSYSLSKTETQFKETTTAFYDQTHILKLTGLLNLNKWKFALSWGYFSGMPIIYSDDNTAVNNSQTIVFDRFDDLHQLDFSSSYTFYNPTKSIKSVIGLSIINAYNQDNIVNIFQNTSSSTYRKASEFSPNIQINITF